MDMTKDKIEVGSKWVAKVDYPYCSGVVLDEVVEIVALSEGIYFRHLSKDRPSSSWKGEFLYWKLYFKPYVEEPFLNLGYFDYPDVDDTGNIVDNVNSPSHYGQGKIEAIEYISDFLTKEEYQGYLRGNIAKYLHRFPYKNGIEDLKKARWYLERLIQEVE